MLKKLIRISSSSRETVIKPMALTLLTSLVQGMGLVLIAPFLAAWLDQRDNDAAFWLAAMCGMLLLYGVTQYFAQASCNRGGVRIAGELFKRLSQHIVTLPLSWFEGPKVGAVSQLMSKGVLEVMSVLAHYLRPIINSFATPATVIAFMIFYDYRIGLTAAIAAPLLWGTYRLAGFLAAKAEYASNQASEEVNSRVIEFARSQPMLRAYDKKELGYKLLTSALKKEQVTGHHLLRITIPAMLCFSIALQVFFGAVIGQGVYLVMQDSINLASLMALMVLAFRFIEPMNLAADLGGSVRIAENILKRMDDVLKAQPLPEPAYRTERKIETPAEVEIDGVCFAYANNLVLRNVSFKAHPGTVTALIGPSGAGKSTILRLIARFSDVLTGSIRVGGVDIQHMPYAQLIRHISFVFQHVYLFDGTIEENIRIGNESCAPEEYASAVDRAGLHEVLEQFPLRDQTQVGEGGAALSGGEKQRIAIARALLKKSSILLLDEVTSSLDFQNQAGIQKTIDLLRPTHTIIIIAHRLQTALTADRIVVLNNAGMVDAIGPHKELIKTCDLYAEFWKQKERVLSWQM